MSHAGLSGVVHVELAFGKTHRDVIVPNGMDVSSSADGADSVDGAPFDIIGDIEIRVHHTSPDQTPADGRVYYSKWNSDAVNQRSISFYLPFAGTPSLKHSTDGTAGTIVTSAATDVIPLADAATGWVAVTLDVSSGDTNFYTYPGVHAAPAALADWTQLGDTVPGAATSIFNSSALPSAGNIKGGSDGGGGFFVGQIHEVELWDGFQADGGTLNANPRFSDVAQWSIGAAASTTGTDAQGNVWTLTSDAVITGSWIDRTTDTVDHNHRNGRQYETRQMEAGRGILRLHNDSRQYEPDYASGTYYPNIVPWVPIRFRYEYGGYSEIGWTGFVEGWKIGYLQRGKKSVATLRLSDGLRMFNRLPFASYEVEVFRDVPDTLYKMQETSGTTATDDGALGVDGTYDSDGAPAAVLDAPTGNAAATLVKAVSAGADRAMLICVTQEGTSPTPTLPTVDYGGQTCTQLADVQDATNQRNRMTVFFIGEPGIAAASTTTITASNVVTDVYVMAGTYKQVEHELIPTEIDTENATGTNPITALSVTTAEDNSVVIAMAAASVGAGTVAWANLTEALDTAGANHNQTWAQDLQAAAATTVNPQATFSSAPVRQCQVAVVIEGTERIPTVGEDGPFAETTSVLFDDNQHDEVTIGAVAGSDVGADFTLEWWMNAHAISELPVQAIVQVDESVGNWMFGAFINRTQDPDFVVGFQAPVGASGWQGETAWDLPFAASGWVHCAMVCDYSEKTVTPYVNGQAGAALVLNQWDQAQTAGTMNLEIANGDSMEHFHGHLAYVAIYPTLLSAGRIKAHYAARSGNMAAQTMQARIANILSNVGWGGGTLLDTTSVTTLTAITDNDTNVLAALRRAAQSEGGIVFIDREGRVAAHSRQYRSLFSSTSQFTFNTNFTDFVAEKDTDVLYNAVTATLPDGTIVRAEDSTSADKYGPSNLPLTNMDLSEATASLLVQEQLGRFKDPTLRTEKIVVNPETDAANLWPQIRDREIGDRITLAATPPGGAGALALDLYIERIEFKGDQQHLEATYQLSPAANDEFWILGDAKLGLLGTSTRLAAY